MRGLIIDNFAGGGGASTGIEMGLGRPVDVAINHDPEAIAVHMANHPETRHYCKNIWQADPEAVVRDAGGGPVALAWFSPDCKHFSKAKGGKPVKRNIRDLAWVVVLWAKRARPRVIMLENVEEFRDWGPLTADGMPCPDRKGETFKRWVGELRRLGYRVEWRELRACDFGAPTIRKRLFLIARCDGLPIVWPEPTHKNPHNSAPDSGKPWRTAADIIDWSIPCPSIFERPRPLAEATLRRIAKGIVRYVLESPRPFIVPITHAGDDRAHDSLEPLRTITTAHRGEMALVSPIIAGCGGRAGQSRPRGGDEPLATTTAKADQILVAPTLIQTGYGERAGQSPRAPGLDKPLGTVVAGGAKHALVSAFMSKYHGDDKPGGRAAPPGEPIRTVDTNNRHAVIAAHLSRQFGHSVGHAADEPAGTVTAGGGGKTALVAAFLAQHNSGMTGHDAREPVSTITQRGTQQAVVAPHLINLKGSDRRMSSIEDPAPTVCAGGWHAGAVLAFLIKYYSAAAHGQAADDPLHAVTSRARFGVVTVEIDGEPWALVDIGMRMLTPRELFRAQGFPDSYIIAPEIDGKPITKTAQIRLAGNSVCPDVAAALVRANVADIAAEARAA